MLAFSTIYKSQTLIRNQISLFIRNYKRPFPVKWEKPKVGYTKLNFDGSCKIRNGDQSSIGGVFRDHEANFLLGYAESIGKSTSTMAELAALRRGLELGLENGWTNLWVEGDAKSLVDIIVNKGEGRCEKAKEHFRYINLVIPELDNCIVTHVYRAGNRVADKLASIGHAKETGCIWHDPPTEVLRLVRDDAGGRDLVLVNDKSVPNM